MERADKTRNNPWASDADVAAAFSSELALGNAAATVCIVMVHFVSSTGHLVYQALFKFNDPAVPSPVNMRTAMQHTVPTHSSAELVREL